MAEPHLVARPRARASLLGRRVDPTYLAAGTSVLVFAGRINLTHNVTAGTVVAVALAPVWLRTLARYRGARLLLTWILAAAIAGVWLTDFSAADHQVSGKLAFASCILLLNVGLGTGLVLWARTVMRSRRWRSGSASDWWPGSPRPGASRRTRGGSGSPSPSSCSCSRSRGTVAAARWRSRSPPGSRSSRPCTTAARCPHSAAACVLTVWWLPSPKGRGQGRLRVIALLATLGLVAYQGGEALILEGLLGSYTQQRTAAQVHAAGSLLLGARPEIGASLALMRHEPWGFGAGTTANSHDIAVAKTGMSQLNYDPNNGYVDTYMFGESIELHSIIGDLWALFGIVGLGLGAYLVVLLASGLAHRLGRRRPPAVVVFAAISSLWEPVPRADLHGLAAAGPQRGARAASRRRRARVLRHDVTEGPSGHPCAAHDRAHPARLPRDVPQHQPERQPQSSAADPRHPTPEEPHPDGRPLQRPARDVQARAHPTLPDRNARRTTHARVARLAGTTSTATASSHQTNRPPR